MKKLSLKLPQKSKKEIDIAINKKHLLKFLLFSICFFVIGCRPNDKKEKPYLQQVNINNSCLEKFNKEDLKQSLENCNDMIKKYPNSPKAFSDRAIINMLNGEVSTACEDIKKAFNLITTQKREIDPLIKYQIIIRKNSCTKM